MSWFWTIMFLSFAFTRASESKPQKPSAIVVGTVYCDTCFQLTPPRASQNFIAGASIAVECNDTRSGRSFRQEVKTDSRGGFKVDLPFPQISNPNDPTFLPPFQLQVPPSNSPTIGIFLPPLPTLPPLPQLPQLPPLPGLPFLPSPPNKVPNLSGTVNQPAGGTLPFPPNPLNLPIPNILPPNPFQASPSTTPPLLPPPSPPLFNLPLIPGLISTPPPPPPPSLQNPLPPFPFQPRAGLPGGPPARVASSSETSFP